MPVWLSLFLWKVVVPVAIELLKKYGFINWAEALGAKTVVAVKNLQTYQEYPGDKILPNITNVTNIRAGSKGEDDGNFPRQKNRGF